MKKENELYYLEYGNSYYTNMQFIRKDTICDTSYMTFKNPLNGDVFTFEMDKIKLLEETPKIELAWTSHTEPLADTASNSLY
ncbi:hypothetical protein [Bacillus sp. FJAT-27445]|uniref:hypothetical protein n=1 Tax=Bacillus sp. FJAT-27445 TaxID=1679166 RepID=UPI0007437AA6|nr:hypothetical protein [Bacillus sp. FJAT-27445]